jgi:hypothetical protein
VPPLRRDVNSRYRLSAVKFEKWKYRLSAVFAAAVIS